MQSTIKRFVGVLTIVTTLILTGLIGFAQNPNTNNEVGTPSPTHRRAGKMGRMGRHGKKNHMFGRLMHQLNLTEQQKTQIKQINENFRASTKQLHEQLRANRQNPLEQLKGGNLDEAAVRAAAQARANIQVELAVAKARKMAQIYAVLTPEQKDKLAQLIEQWKQRANNFKQRRQGAVPNVTQ
jgi:Spy/CpxP family protein refolding chaperone